MELFVPHVTILFENSKQYFCSIKCFQVHCRRVRYISDEKMYDEPEEPEGFSGDNRT